MGFRLAASENDADIYRRLKVRPMPTTAEIAERLDVAFSHVAEVQARVAQLESSSARIDQWVSHSENAPASRPLQPSNDSVRHDGGKNGGNRR